MTKKQLLKNLIESQSKLLDAIISIIDNENDLAFDILFDLEGKINDIQVDLCKMKYEKMGKKIEG
ncbi:unnamed protein product [marine sediment metagenome]|uniref:Uncharacterized protein n=1 Tax=marine sediment metagenome TaxID=412755 RepID=X0WKE8_9ZZZZ